MKEPKRKMRAREKAIIYFLLAMGLLGAGFQLWLNSQTHLW